jgi:hypothetical protein
MHSVLICDTPSDDGQQCCQVSSISIKAFKSYGPDTNCTDRLIDGQMVGRTDKVIPIYPLHFVSGGRGNGTSSLAKFVTLNLHLCIPLLFETHLLMMDNNVTKYHQYPSRHLKVMDRTRFAQTDGRTGGRKDRQSDSYIFLSNSSEGAR